MRSLSVCNMRTCAGLHCICGLGEQTSWNECRALWYGTVQSICCRPLLKFGLIEFHLKSCQFTRIHLCPSQWRHNFLSLVACLDKKDTCSLRSVKGSTDLGSFEQPRYRRKTDDTTASRGNLRLIPASVKEPIFQTGCAVI